MSSEGCINLHSSFGHYIWILWADGSDKEAQSWGTESGAIDDLYSPQSLELNLDTEASGSGRFGAEKTKKWQVHLLLLCT